MVLHTVPAEQAPASEVGQNPLLLLGGATGPLQSVLSGNGVGVEHRHHSLAQEPG